MIVWLSKRLVLSIHDRLLAEHGGTAGVRDEGLLESALARPRQLYAYGDPAPDLAGLAASLTYGLARNHPFVDGNKRTAYATCLTFLALNGADVVAAGEDKYLTFLALGEGRVSVEELAEWLRAYSRLSNQDQVQEPAPACPSRP